MLQVQKRQDTPTDIFGNIDHFIVHTLLGERLCSHIGYEYIYMHYHLFDEHIILIYELKRGIYKMKIYNNAYSIKQGKIYWMKTQLEQSLIENLYHFYFGNRNPLLTL